MARQTNIKISGSIENLIFYNRKKGFYVRTKPASVKQSAATQKRSSDFGKAAQLEKVFRHLLTNAIPDSKDRAMQRRFRTALYKYLTAQIPVCGFEFNTESLLAERLKQRTALFQNHAQQIILQMPSLIPDKHITAPVHTISVKMNICVAYCNIENMNDCNSFQTTFDFAYNNIATASSNITMPFEISSDCLLLSAVNLRYEKANTHTPVTDKRWLPAGITAQLPQT